MPTSYTVLDSGVLLASIQIEPYTAHAKTLIKRLIEADTQLAAPIL